MADQHSIKSILLKIVLGTIKKRGVYKCLDKFGEILKDHPDFLPIIKDKYPEHKNQINLWQKLQGVDEQK